MIEQSHAHMDIGEIEEEVKGCDDQIDELSGTRKPRKYRRSVNQKRTRESALESAAIGKERQARCRQRAGQREESEDEDTDMGFVTAEAGDTQRDCARHLQSTPSKQSTRKATRMRSRWRRVMCAVQTTKTMTP